MSIKQKIYKHYRGTPFLMLLTILGVIYGYFFPSSVGFIKPIGDIFMQLIRMLLIPIIIITLMHAIVGINSDKGFAKLISKTLLTFAAFSAGACLLGIGIAQWIQPGHLKATLPIELLTLPDNMLGDNAIKPLSISAFILGIIPQNPFAAIGTGKLLSIIFFAIFFALGILHVKTPNKQGIINAIAISNDSLIWMMGKIMLLAPIAIFSLMAYLVGTMGIDILAVAGKLIGTVVLVDILWVYGVLAILVALTTKISYGKFVKSIIPLQLMAFTTSSSLVSLPLNMSITKSMGVRDHITNFVLPLGATIHMNGSALFYGIVTVFFAQFFGIELTITDYILMAIMATLGSMATPGIPGLSLTIVMVMVVANVPLIGLPLVFAIDRILDMFTTTVNVVGDTATATIIDAHSDKNHDNKSM